VIKRIAELLKDQCRRLLIALLFITIVSGCFTKFNLTFAADRVLKPTSLELLVDGFKLPVYEIEKNYFVSVRQLMCVGYDVYQQDDKCIMLFRNPQKPKHVVYPSTYVYRITPKPYYSCYIDGYKVPVVFISNEPFIFANELFKENKVEKTESGYSIMLQEPRTYVREETIAQYLGEKRLMDDDVVMYLVSMYYFDVAHKKTGKIMLIKDDTESMSKLLYLYLMQPRFIVYRVAIEALYFSDANTEQKKFLERNLNGLPLWLENEYMKPETFFKDLFIANLNRKAWGSDIYPQLQGNTVRLYNLTTNVYYSVSIKAEIDTSGADNIIKTFTFNNVTLLPLGQTTIQLPAGAKIKKIISVQGVIL